MNKRMNELHVEAARYAKEKYPNDIVEWSICMSERFATQLVGECVLAILATDTRSMTYTTYDKSVVDSVLSRVVDSVRDHFKENANV